MKKRSFSKKKIWNHVKELQYESLNANIPKQTVQEKLVEFCFQMIRQGYSHKELLQLELEIMMNMGEKNTAIETFRRFLHIPSIQGEKSFYYSTNEAVFSSIFWSYLGEKEKADESIRKVDVDKHLTEAKYVTFLLPSLRRIYPSQLVDSLQLKAQTIVSRRKDFLLLGYHLLDLVKSGKRARAEKLLLKYFPEAWEAFQRKEIGGWFFLCATYVYLEENLAQMNPKLSTLFQKYQFLVKSDQWQEKLEMVLVESASSFDARNENSWYSKKLREIIQESKR